MIEYILDELDSLYQGVPSHSYVKHIEQNWAHEPFIHSAYLADYNSTRISKVLFEPIDDKVYFSGEAYTKEDDWASVHNAARAAKEAITHMLGS